MNDYIYYIDTQTVIIIFIFFSSFLLSKIIYLLPLTVMCVWIFIKIILSICKLCQKSYSDTLIGFFGFCILFTLKHISISFHFFFVWFVLFFVHWKWLYFNSYDTIWSGWTLNFLYLYTHHAVIIIHRLINFLKLKTEIIRQKRKLCKAISSLRFFFLVMILFWL